MWCMYLVEFPVFSFGILQLSLSNGYGLIVTCFPCGRALCFYILKNLPGQGDFLHDAYVRLSGILWFNWICECVLQRTRTASIWAVLCFSAWTMQISWHHILAKYIVIMEKEEKTKMCNPTWEVKPKICGGWIPSSDSPTSVNTKSIAYSTLDQ